MGNTEFRILATINDHGALSAHALFTQFYATSKQPGKKCAGLYRHLRSLARQGYVQCVQRVPGSKMTEERYVLTPAGRAAGVEHQQGRERPAAAQFPRLAR